MKPVYFIQDELTGLIKIGASAHPHLRRYQLQTANAGKLRLLSVLTDFSEAHYHILFREQRVRGEWYRPIAMTWYVMCVSNHLDPEIVGLSDYLDNDEYDYGATMNAHPKGFNELVRYCPTA